MEDRIEKIAILAAQVLQVSIRSIKITYFASSKTWLLTDSGGAFRVNGEPYYAESLNDLEQAIIDFKNGL